MANYANLLATIAANIYTNNNEEVTAAMVKAVCNAMVAELGAGYQYMGLAYTTTTPPVNPDERIFYIAAGPGTFTNFDGLQVTQGVTVLRYNGTSWVMDKVISADLQPSLKSKNIVMSNGVYGEINRVDFDKVYVVRKNLFDPTAAVDNYYINSLGEHAASPTFACSEIIPVVPDADYHISAANDAPVGNSNSYGIYYKLDGTTSLFSTNGTNIHTPADCFAIEFSFAKVRTEVQVETGSSRTAYEAFRPGDFDILSALDRNPLEDLLFTQMPANLAGGYNCYNNVYVNGSGALVSNAAYKTYIIPVVPGTEYQFLATDQIGSARNIVVWKDLNGGVLSTGSDLNGETAPQGARYLYISFPVETRAQVTAGSAAVAYVSGNVFVSPRIIYDYDMILPRQVFIIGGEQNSVYHALYCRNYDDRLCYADRNGGVWTFKKRCWRVEADESPNGNLSFHLRDRRTGEALKSYSIPTRVGNKTKTSTNIKVNVIGDSFCYGGHYLQHIANMCGNSTFVGMRLSESNNIPCEGRGGWSLATYFNPKSPDIALTHMQPFSPFMHDSTHTYYGVMEFWASIVNGTSQYNYGTAGFTNYVSWFDTNGRKKNPSVNDMVYNQTAGKFEYWSGSSWVQLAQEPTFSFNYAKYVSTWNITSPDFVVMQLGTNDFFAGDSGVDEWIQRMDLVVASINAYATAVGKTINIFICTPIPAAGLPNNNYGDGIIKRDIGYYNARQRIIERYDPSTNFVNDHVTIVDTGVVVDNDYGFLTEERLPFAYYDGDARELYDYNGVHPSRPGYKQFANPIAGAIQYYR